MLQAASLMLVIQIKHLHHVYEDLISITVNREERGGFLITFEPMY